ncbi:peptidase C48, SUMO/sentrin/Ubl1 [Tanacetum coccineum]
MSNPSRVGGLSAGIISKIRVENFMCHSHMEINLADHINFITGQNGSVKDIGRVSPIKSKVTGKSDSPRRRWILLSERVSNKPGDIVVNAQPVSQYNPVTGQVVKESDKVQQPKVKLAVDEKDNPKVKPAVVKEKPAVVKEKPAVVKEKPAVVKEKPAVVKEKPAGVTSKVSKGKDDVVKALVAADKDDVIKAPVVADEVLVVADMALVVKATVADKAPVVKATVAYNVVLDKELVKEKSASNVGKAPVKDKVKVSILKDDMVLNKAMGKEKVEDNVKAPVKENVKASVKYKPKHKAPVKDKPKQKVIPTVQELSEVPVLRSSNQKVKPEVKSKEDDRKKKLNGKSKKEEFDSELEIDIDSSSDEVDRKQKKLKIKVGLKRKRSGSDCLDSSSIDTENIKRLISKLEKKVKREVSDKESVPKKGKKKLTKKVKKEGSDEESVRRKTTPSSLFSAIRNSRVDILSFLSGDYIELICPGIV